MSGRSHIDPDAVREALTTELAEIERQDLLGAEGQKTVELDQTSVGRLSRMDALQQQALAQETQRRRNLRRQRIRETLARIEQDEFGYCEQCGEEIAPKRFALDWTVRTSVRCAS